MRSFLSSLTSFTFTVPAILRARRLTWPAAITLAACVVVLAASIMDGGPADAGPFSRCRIFRKTRSSSCQTIEPQAMQAPSQPAIGPLPESQAPAPPVPPLWWEEELTDVTYLQPPDTALDPVPGTGSRLGIGGKIPDKIGLKLDPALLDALKKLLAGSLQPTQPVPITLPVAEETSQRLSRILMILEWLAWLGLGTGGASLAGRLGPLVARLAAGLPSAIPVASPPPQTTVAAQSSPPAKT